MQSTSQYTHGTWHEASQKFDYFLNAVARLGTSSPAKGGDFYPSFTPPRIVSEAPVANV